MSLFCSVPVCGVIGSSQVDRPVRSSKITLMINLFLNLLWLRSLATPILHVKLLHPFAEGLYLPLIQRKGCKKVTTLKIPALTP